MIDLNQEQFSIVPHNYFPNILISLSIPHPVFKPIRSPPLYSQIDPESDHLSPPCALLPQVIPSPFLTWLLQELPNSPLYSYSSRACFPHGARVIFLNVKPDLIKHLFETVQLSITLRIENKLPTMGQKAVPDTLAFSSIPHKCLAQAHLGSLALTITIPYAEDDLSWNSLFLQIVAWISAQMSRLQRALL